MSGECSSYLLTDSTIWLWPKLAEFIIIIIHLYSKSPIKKCLVYLKIQDYKELSLNNCMNEHIYHDKYPFEIYQTTKKTSFITTNLFCFLSLIKKNIEGSQKIFVV